MARLIRVRFPDLCDHVLPLNAPMEIAAMTAKKECAEKTGLPLEEIGAFFITPCPAKVTDIKVPIGTGRSWLDGAISISEIFPRLSGAMDKLQAIDPISRSGVIGVSWASSGGEAAALLNEKYLAADGIENVIRVLEELEDERIPRARFHRTQRLLGRLRGRRALRGERLRRQSAHPAPAQISARLPEPSDRGDSQKHGLDRFAGIRPRDGAFLRPGGGPCA